ncbi:NADPH-dependent FMN reductase [Winogradskyella alexanderae]|uniref:NAD(P)H-dependent oxidoreductase n=1 Tax=Winogradskyella alexanderae TaxID=2877123 RepID=A0ABS7XUP0_9FLAO|nr:NAD(P)H-dependent oxidoreductase [Winogradskyella alexanderae]MCA0132637.1 NAD(P)H-dependent oxidoreductase [Winogradskyella alexanderae]
MKKIIAFAGSISSASINRKLAIYASSLVKNAEVKVLDLNDYEMPLYSVDREKASGQPQEAVDFVNEIRSSDGIIISLAEYNGSYSGAFKNVFDWASRVEAKTFLGKPMLLMATSPGGRGGQSVLDMASDRFPRHDANIVGKFSLPSFNDNFGDGKISNEDLNNALQEQVKQFEESL